MTGKLLKEKLTRGETVFGTFFQHAVTPAIVDFLPEGSLDFVIVSAEHNALDLAEFLPIRYALASKGIVRRVMGGRGDQLVEIGVEVPTRLTDEQKELITRFASTLGEAPQEPERESFMDKLKNLFG